MYVQQKKRDSQKMCSNDTYIYISYYSFPTTLDCSKYMNKWGELTHLRAVGSSPPSNNLHKLQ